MSHFGRIVRYVSLKGEVVSGIVTNALVEDKVNIQLFPDGVNQAHLPSHVYTVSHAPVHPDGSMQPNSWHWPPRS